MFVSCHMCACVDEDPLLSFSAVCVLRRRWWRLGVSSGDGRVLSRVCVDEETSSVNTLRQIDAYKYKCVCTVSNLALEISV